jgi:hypothetical protein
MQCLKPAGGSGVVASADPWESRDHSLLVD